MMKSQGDSTTTALSRINIDSGLYERMRRRVHALNAVGEAKTMRGFTEAAIEGKLAADKAPEFLPPAA